MIPLETMWRTYKQTKIRKTAYGSSTVFFALILLLIASLIFSLLEASRVTGLKSCARLNSALVTESVLAGYVRPLWDNYHLFMLNAADETGALRADVISEAAFALAEENLVSEEGRGLWLYPMRAEQVMLNGYSLATDGNGKEFYYLVTDYMKENLALEAASALYQSLQEAEQIHTAGGDVDKVVEDAKDSLKEIEKAESETQQNTAMQQYEAESIKTGVQNIDGLQVTAMQEQTANVGNMNQENVQESKKNPLELIGEWKANGVLTMVGANEEALSSKYLDTRNCLERRTKNIGTLESAAAADGWYEKILFQEYLIKYFNSYRTGESNNSVLDYELEYLLTGKDTDKENLAAVCEKLLLMRTAANYIYLQKDTVKSQAALTMAAGLVGAGVGGLVIKGIQQGILVVWAFAEGISDVKALLAGERIALMKTAENWTSDLMELNDKESFDASKSCAEGLDYEEYLRILLFCTGEEKLCMRAMDLMERNVQQKEGYETLSMDCLITGVSLQYTYRAKPLFLSFVTVGNQRMEDYSFTQRVKASYLDDTIPAN